jgi:putative phage-type endonuclease
MSKTFIQPTNTNEWLALRSKGIGGSDISAILGLTKWKTPLEVYLEKTGQAAPVEENDSMRRGKILEKLVIDRFGREEENITISAPNWIYPHPKKDFIFGSPDQFYVRQKTKLDGNLECKTTKMEIETCLPEWYTQGQLYCGVTGKEELSVAWFVLPQSFKDSELAKFKDATVDELRALEIVFDYHSEVFPRNDDYIKYLEEEAEKFWKDNVLKRVPPNPMNLTDLAYLYPSRMKGKSLNGNLECVKLYDEYLTYNKTKLDAEKMVKELAQQIKLIMKDAEQLKFEDKLLFTLKDVNKDIVDNDKLKKDGIYEQYLKTTTYQLLAAK